MSNHLLSSNTGKGILFGLVASLFLCSGNASAQDYIGGSVSILGSASRDASSETTQSNSIKVAPDLGWYFGDNWAFGIRPSVGFRTSNFNENSQGRLFSLGFNPYARYLLLDYNRFGLWAEASPEIGIQREWSRTSGGDWESGNRIFHYNIQLVPVLTYQLNDHISLESRLNLFSLAFVGSHTTHDDGYIHDSFSYGLSATTKDVTGTLENITIGLLYKF